MKHYLSAFFSLWNMVQGIDNFFLVHGGYPLLFAGEISIF